MNELHPAENRGYRELYLTGRQLVHHWMRLADVLADTEVSVALSNSAGAVREMLAELGPLTAEHDLYGGVAAQGSGARIGRTRADFSDRFLERNQAVRFALHDLEHLTVLLAYLAAVSGGRGDPRLPTFCRSWEQRLDRHAANVRAETVRMGDDPDAAIQPLDDSPLSRGAHSIPYSIGRFGEWLDRRAGHRNR